MLVALRRYQRNGIPIGSLIPDLTALSEQLAAAENTDSIRGLEGAASAAWFRFLGSLFRAPWSFTQRTRRPPTDPVNALLSLGYTWLLNKATAGLEANGYEIYLGGLHEYRPGRPSLACDLIEPLRVPAVDRWVAAACAQGELQPQQFVKEEGGGFRLQPAAFGKTLFLWEKFWSEATGDERVRQWLDNLARFIRERTETPSATDSEPDVL